MLAGGIISLILIGSQSCDPCTDCGPRIGEPTIAATFYNIDSLLLVQDSLVIVDTLQLVTDSLLFLIDSIAVSRVSSYLRECEPAGCSKHEPDQSRTLELIKHQWKVFPLRSISRVKQVENPSFVLKSD